MLPVVLLLNWCLIQISPTCLTWSIILNGLNIHKISHINKCYSGSVHGAGGSSRSSFLFLSSSFLQGRTERFLHSSPILSKYHAFNSEYTFECKSLIIMLKKDELYFVAVFCSGSVATAGGASGRNCVLQHQHGKRGYYRHHQMTKSDWIKIAN